MEPEYDLSKMKKRPNPFAKQLKKQVTISLGIDVIEYFETMAGVQRARECCDAAPDSPVAACTGQ